MELLALFLVIPIGLYLVHERGRSRAWGLVSAGEEKRGLGAYREAHVRLWKRGAAPLTVRIAAVSSFFLGQMILPGALAALVGLVAAAEILSNGHGPALVIVLELSAPTGLVVAAHLLGAGSAMLARADDAAAKGRRAARWAIGHNLALLGALALLAVLQPDEAAKTLPSVIYAFVSIGQALVVRSAAHALDAYAAEQDHDPVPEATVLEIPRLEALTPAPLDVGRECCYLASARVRCARAEARPMLIDEVRARVGRLEIPFNACGIDPYGISRDHLAYFFTGLGFLYKRYFRVRAHGLSHIPARGRVMLVGNHSGGVAIDGAMVIASMFFDLDPPRIAQGMVEKFINKVPFASLWSNRTGQFTGIPETAEKLLEDERMLMVFPEGARGTAKLFKERYSLVQFGTGFVRLAMKTRTPIVPFGFIGGGEAIPTIANSYAIGRLFGAPYVPITPYLIAMPLPVRLAVHYGEPLVFSGTGSEDDHVINGHVEQVKDRILGLIDEGRRERGDKAAERDA